MLLVDEAYLDENGVAHGIYNVKGDEWFLQGHFPGNPIVPGVIQCEMAGQTCCAEAAFMARALRPVSEPALVQRLVNETDDACRLMAGFGSPSFGQLPDVSNPLRRAEAGACLSLGELLRIADLLRTIRSISQWRSHCEGVSTCLDDRFAVLTPNKYIEEKITSVVLNEEEVADNASPALADIRRKMRSASVKVREQ